MKRKKVKKISAFWSGDLNPKFSVIFLPMIWIFMWSEEPKIKSKQASKRDRTLKQHDFFCQNFLAYSKNILGQSKIILDLQKDQTLIVFWADYIEQGKGSLDFGHLPDSSKDFENSTDRLSTYLEPNFSSMKLWTA